MDKQKYMIFFDVDGTLTPSGNTYINDSVLEQIDRLKALGHILIISTGRSYNRTKVIRGAEKFNYISSLMGNMIVKQNDGNIKVLRDVPLNCNYLEEFIAYIENNHFFWDYKDKFGDRTTDKTGYIQKKYYATIISKDELYEDIKNKQVYQLLVDNKLPEEIKKEYPNFNFYEMPKGYTDVVSKGSSKANAIQFFKEKFNNYTTVAIGDAENDVEMFKNVDISIAMGNATDKIKKLTTYVTTSLDENGVVYAIKNILKI